VAVHGAGKGTVRVDAAIADPETGDDVGAVRPRSGDALVVGGAVSGVVLVVGDGAGIGVP
jgi:hypothetical protein